MCSPHQKCVGQINCDFKRPTRTDARAGDTVDLARIATRCTIPSGQMFVIFGFAASHPKATGIFTLSIHDVISEIRAVTAITVQRRCQRYGPRHRDIRKRKRRGHCQCCKSTFMPVCLFQRNGTRTSIDPRLCPLLARRAEHHLTPIRFLLQRSVRNEPLRSAINESGRPAGRSATSSINDDLVAISAATCV